MSATAYPYPRAAKEPQTRSLEADPSSMASTGGSATALHLLMLIHKATCRLLQPAACRNDERRMDAASKTFALSLSYERKQFFFLGGILFFQKKRKRQQQKRK